jgi:hypothetical protein
MGDDLELDFEFGLDYDDLSKAVVVVGADQEYVKQVMSEGVRIDGGDDEMIDLLGKETGVSLPHVSGGKIVYYKPDQGEKFLQALYIRWGRNTGYSSSKPIME